jgi:hypothetical protein
VFGDELKLKTDLGFEFFQLEAIMGKRVAEIPSPQRLHGCQRFPNASHGRVERALKDNRIHYLSFSSHTFVCVDRLPSIAFLFQELSQLGANDGRPALLEILASERCRLRESVQTFVGKFQARLLVFRKQFERD